MKDYKRLTKRCGDIVNYAKPLQSNFIGAIYEEQKERDSEIMSRLAELEDKIESGELCDREEVRKETAKEILNKVYASVERVRLECEFQDEKGNWLMDEGEFLSEFTLGDLHNLYAEYGIELFGNSDKLSYIDNAGETYSATIESEDGDYAVIELSDGHRLRVSKEELK